MRTDEMLRKMLSDFVRQTHGTMPSCIYLGADVLLRLKADAGVRQLQLYEVKGGIHEMKFDGVLVLEVRGSPHHIGIGSYAKTAEA